MKYFRISCSLCLLIGIVIFLYLVVCERSSKINENQLSALPAVKTIKITPAEMSLATGQGLQLSVKLTDAAGNTLNVNNKSRPTIADTKGRGGRIVEWSSSRPSIVKVDNNGSVTALREGVAKITASSEKAHESIKISVYEPPAFNTSISPISATLSIGESLQLTITPHNAGKISEPIMWSSDQPTRAQVDQNGLVTALSAGKVKITAKSKQLSGQASLNITPLKTITGIDFPGSAGVKKTMRIEFSDPLPAYPATYIWRAYPRQQLSYYTAFFWGNNGSFYSKNTYYGFHPYPDWNTESQHFWEIAAPPGGDFVSQRHVDYDRWYIQVAVCKQEGNRTIEEFYWDWPDTSKVIRHNEERYADPPEPALIVGDAPWNQGNEVWDGVLRGFQFYDAALTLEEIKKEIASPGDIRLPWYLNLDPAPSDVSDKSGNNHHPSWVGTERPKLWRGTSDAR